MTRKRDVERRIDDLEATDGEGEGEIIKWDNGETLYLPPETPTIAEILSDEMEPQRSEDTGDTE